MQERLAIISGQIARSTDDRGCCLQNGLSVEEIKKDFFTSILLALPSHCLYGGSSHTFASHST